VVAFARVAGGVHWPSDALGGLALGAVAAVLAQFGFNWFDQRARAAAASGIVSGS
jgi:membrane-associated phospholipid phosphatase